MFENDVQSICDARCPENSGVWFHTFFLHVDKTNLVASDAVNEQTQSHTDFITHIQSNMCSDSRWFLSTPHRSVLLKLWKLFGFMNMKHECCVDHLLVWIQCTHTHIHIYAKLYHKLHIFPHFIENAATFHENVISTDLCSFFARSLSLPLSRFWHFALVGLLFLYHVVHELWQNHNERNEHKWIYLQSNVNLVIQVYLSCEIFTNEIVMQLTQIFAKRMNEAATVWSIERQWNIKIREKKERERNLVKICLVRSSWEFDIM